MLEGIELIFRGFLRQFLALIDGSIYTIAAEIYGLMLDIAEARIFTQTAIDEMAARIYQLLGLIMLFKLIFSFLTYVVNPEAIADKTKGLGNIIKRIIISLGLIVITPWAFMQSRNLQAYIIQDGLIEYFITGQSTIDDIDPGYKLMLTTAKTFIKPHLCASNGCKQCATVTVNGESVCQKCGSNWEDSVTGDQRACGFGSEGFGNSEDFYKELQRAVNSIPSNRGKKYDLFALMRLPSYGDGKKPFGLLFYVDLQYPLIGTTVVGIVIVYMLVIMCIDIAVRSVKLSFYEIISPIPIVSYIGFKDGKDSMLSKWFSQVLKTYADLFTRVLALQFSVYFIGFLIDMQKYEDLVTLFLIIGALTFAKQFPNILKDLGINFEGGGFNLKKKLNEDMAGSKLIKRAGAAGLGLVGGAGANLYKSALNNYKRKQELKKAMQAAGKPYNDRGERKAFLQDPDNEQYGNLRQRKKYAARTAGNIAKNKALSEGKTLRDADVIYKEVASDTSRNYRREHASEYRSSIIGGALSGAYHSATSKDGKIFAGAREGTKESVDARDIRDKRQEAGYGTTTRWADNVRIIAGVDPESKLRANAMRDEINELEAEASRLQYKLNSLDPVRDATDYNATMNAIKQQKVAIAKRNKDLEKLYESSKK